MKREELERVVDDTWKYGPDRVMGDDGELRSFEDSHALGIDVAFVLIREDGWTLGCPVDILRMAHDVSPDSWNSIMIKPDPVPIPIQYLYDYLEDRITLQEFLEMTNPEKGVLH